MKHIGVCAPGTQSQLDPGNQNCCQRIERRQSYRACEGTVGHDTKIIRVGHWFWLRRGSIGCLLKVRKLFTLFKGEAQAEREARWTLTVVTRSMGVIASPILTSRSSCRGN